MLDNCGTITNEEGVGWVFRSADNPTQPYLLCPGRASRDKAEEMADTMVATLLQGSSRRTYNRYRGIMWDTLKDLPDRPAARDAGSSGGVGVPT